MVRGTKVLNCLSLATMAKPRLSDFTVCTYGPRVAALMQD